MMTELTETQTRHVLTGLYGVVFVLILVITIIGLVRSVFWAIMAALILVWVTAIMVGRDAERITRWRK